MTGALFATLIGAIAVLVMAMRYQSEKVARQRADELAAALADSLEKEKAAHADSVARLEAAVQARDKLLDAALEECRAIRDPSVLRERLRRTLSAPRPSAAAGEPAGLSAGAAAGPAGPAAPRS